MIDDFLGFLEYYHNADSRLQTPYSEPLVRIEYDEVTKNGDVVIALLAPFSHAINALCYREPGCEFYYSQRRIAKICHVSEAEVTAWKKEERIPDKYHWFLLLVDISESVEDSYGRKVIRPPSKSYMENICDSFLRMAKACYEPFCIDDTVLMDCVWRGYGVEKAEELLLEVNFVFWSKLLKK